jgi:hypothetical protein
MSDMADVSPVDLQKALGGASYPAGRDDLVALAEGNNAPDAVLEALRALPDRRFDGPDAVSKEVFHH